MSATTTGVTIIGGRNDGSICGLNQDPPTPLIIPDGQAVTFTHNTGKRAYKINVTNLDATDPVSTEAYTAANMNVSPDAAAPPGNGVYPGIAIIQPAASPGVYNQIIVENTSGADVACCIQVFWEVKSEELSLVYADGNANPSTDKNDSRITYSTGP